MFLGWLKSEKRVSVDRMRTYVNTHLLTESVCGTTVQDLADKFGLRLPISCVTIHWWVTEAGCVFDRFKQTYYIHVHNKP